MDPPMAVTRRTHIPLLTALLTTGALLFAPAMALAGGSGGAGVTGTSGSGSNPLVTPANQPVTSSGNGLTLETLEAGQTARALRFSGTAPAADAGRTIELEYATAGPVSSWVVCAQALVARGGTFTAAWRDRRSGQVEVEALLLPQPTTTTSGTGGGTTGSGSGGTTAGSGAATSDATSLSGSPSPGTAPLTVSIYESAVATLYGPGLYGRHTACGETLRRKTLGVASRTLACGTRVSILFRGRAIVVPVIDRGPYAHDADWDLTMATARALGIRTTTTIGALPPPPRAVQPTTS
jgi:hypothetical protein